MALSWNNGHWANKGKKRGIELKQNAAELRFTQISAKPKPQEARSQSVGAIEDGEWEKDKKEKLKRWAAVDNKSFIKRMFCKIVSYGEDKNVDIS